MMKNLINVSGTMTSLGASRARPEVIAAVADILGRFVAIDELQAHASKMIARATGAEAAMSPHRVHRAYELTDERWREVLGINLDSVLNSVKSALPHMTSGPGPGSSIINISSVQGLRGQPHGASEAGRHARTPDCSAAPHIASGRC